MKAKTVLYVRLPCWKIFPGGVVYVADYIHKQRPDIDQHLLDLALIPQGERRAALAQAIRTRQPDIVAFSWRNMQSFGPHPEDDALDQVMEFDHSRNPWRRLRAMLGGLAIIYDYSLQRLRNFGYMKLARRLLPQARIVVGGTAVTIFGKYVAEQCPPNSVVVIGEGEAAMLSLVDGFEQPAGEFYYKDQDGRVSHQERGDLFDLKTLTAVDFRYIESIFPAFRQYMGDVIGVHTKRGCPFQCHFCLYNKIEGPRQRDRDPAEVAKEIQTLADDYGITHVWFTDAQFCSTQKSTRHVEAVLDEMIARDIKVQWSGYVRLNHLTPSVARKMLATGMCSIDLSFTGSQEMIDALTLGYSLDQQMAAFRMFKENGYTNQQVKLYLPLNGPGETVETLRQTIDKIKELYALFGRDNVLPFIFFIGIQPNTPVEKLLIKQGYLKEGYNPLTLNPFTIKKLLYNPPPLGGLIARAYLEAVKTVDANSDYIGRATMDILERELDKLPRTKKEEPTALVAE
ncbi:MAG TPA: radical SAM protein [Rhodospirillaceae bacterium]|nr:radical SAM protein [Rhodospirillaceae bacterium]